MNSTMAHANPWWVSASSTEIAHRAGQGNWGAFSAMSIPISAILDLAASWECQMKDVQLPWLCWNIHEDWCKIQQKLVCSVGWTPIIGFDPRVGPPKYISDGAVVIDFNAGIGLPVLYPHFPLEFVFMFSDRLAFWHSDLLLRKPMMEKLAALFSEIPKGSTAAVACPPGLREIFSVRKKRYWELVGCTTREASRLQFENGCGWWMSFAFHPNCPNEKEKMERLRYYWDHGAGIYYWQKRKNGHVYAIKENNIREGHFTKIGKSDYRRSILPENGSDAQRLMRREIEDNFDLASACQKLGLGELL
jgi:hypothetical protein